MILRVKLSHVMGRLGICLLALLILALAGPTVAIASDVWSVYQHDARHSGQSSYEAPQTPNIKWVVPFGTTGKPTTPVIVSEDGNAFVGVSVTPAAESTTTTTTTKQSAGMGHSGVFAFDSKQKVLWVSQVKGEVSGPLALGDDGTVYAVIGSTLVALNGKDGSADWKLALDGTSPGGVMLGEDGTIYVGTLKGKTLYAVTKDGALKWKFTAGGQIDSSPAIADNGTVYFTAQDLHLYAISPVGALKWKYKVPEKETTSASSPVLAKDGTVYFTGSRFEGSPGKDYLYAVTPSGTLKWRYQANGKKLTMPAVRNDGVVIVSATTLNYTEDRDFTIGDCYVHAIKPDSSPVWNFKTRDNEIAGAAVIDGNGDVYVSSPDWYLTCVTKGGVMRWRAKIGGKVTIGPKDVLYVAANASIAAVNDKSEVSVKKQADATLNDAARGAGVGGTLSLLIYAIPVLVALGIGFLLKSRIGEKEGDGEESEG